MARVSFAFRGPGRLYHCLYLGQMLKISLVWDAFISRMLLPAFWPVTKALSGYLRCLVGVVTLFCCFGGDGFGVSVRAQTYPTRNVRLLAPFAPGGTNDRIARLLAQHFLARYGQSFIVENRPGAGGLLANDIVAKAAPDGHTLLVTNPAFVMSAGLFKRLPYDPIRDFSPISEIMRAPNVLVIHGAFPAQTLSEFISVVRSRPGDFNYGSGGFGSALHLYSELFNKVAKVKLTHVPFKGGGDNMTALLGGQVHLNIIQYQPTVLSLIRNGRLRALAVTTESKRSRALPDVPSMVEAGLAGLSIYTWAGLIGPAKIPSVLTHELQSSVAQLVADPKVSDLFKDQDTEMVGSTPEAFAVSLKKQMTMWRELIESTGITAP